MDATALRREADRCRRLAGTTTHDQTIRTLLSMASEYEALAAALQSNDEPNPDREGDEVGK